MKPTIHIRIELGRGGIKGKEIPKVGRVSMG